MYLNERFKKFPIKFFQNLQTDEVEYESGFTQGSTKTLNDAFKIFDTEEFIRDVYYYYDDVVDIRIGRFIPSLDDKIRKGRKYLGMLELELDIEPQKGEQNKTATYLNKHRSEIPAHMQYIKDMKRKEQINNMKNNFKKGINRFIKFLKGEKVYEMFSPLKSTTQLICKHCGRVIQIGTYYESYRNQDYHIECIWDKLINKMPENSYQASEEFFFSLQEYIGKWPAYGFDVEEDYVSDLELVKHNNRLLKREPFTESAKMLLESLKYYENL